MNREQIIKRLKITAIISMAYFAIAAIFGIFAVSDFFGDSQRAEEFYLILFKSIGEGGMGFFFVGFIAIFVYSIFLLSGIEKKSHLKKSRFDFLFKIIRAVIIINMAGAALFFVRSQAEVGGDPHKYGNGYVVTYRGDVVKEITERQYYEFSSLIHNSTKMIVCGVFLLFTGLFSINILEALLEINSYMKRTDFRD